MGWYLSRKYFAPKTGDHVHDELMNLYDVMRPVAVQLVESFALPLELIKAPIAGDWLEAYSFSLSSQLLRFPPSRFITQYA